MSPQDIADRLNTIARYDLEVVGWEAQDLVQREDGSWMKVSDIVKAFGLTGEYSDRIKVDDK